MPSGVQIKKVRVEKPEQSIRPIRTSKSETFVKPRSTHHICIFEKNVRGKKKREPVFVTMLEAVQRVRDKQPVIDRTCSDPGVRFVMSLSSREMVLEEKDGVTRLLLFKTGVSTSGQLRFIEHTEPVKMTTLR